MAGSREGSEEPEEEETARPGFQVSGTCAVLPADNTLHFVSQQLTADPAGDTFLDCGGERWGGGTGLQEHREQRCAFHS